MPALRVVRTIPASVSVESSLVFFRPDGRRAIAVDGESGRTWLLEVDPERRAAELNPLPITIPPEHRKLLGERGLAHSSALDRVVVWTDRARVYALPSGEPVAEIDRVPGRCLCMSPDGKWLVSLEQDHAWTMDLESPSPTWNGTGVFHQGEPAEWTPRERSRDDEGSPEDDDGPEPPERESLYLDHVDWAVAVAWWGEPKLGTPDEGMFWLLAGCYGFVQSHLAIPSFTGWGLGRVVGESRAFGGLVYDPIDLLQPAGPRHVLVTHGSGAGLTAVDPATGESFHCRMRLSGGHSYSFFRGSTPCGTAPMAWVRCADGDFLWRFGAAPERMPAAPGRVLALYPDALLCATSGGLAWVEAPGGDFAAAAVDAEGAGPAPAEAARPGSSGPARGAAAEGWLAGVLRRLRG